MTEAGFEALMVARHGTEVAGTEVHPTKAPEGWDGFPCRKGSLITQIEEQTETSDRTEQAEGLEVRIARQLLDQAKAEGVSLIGPGGLLAGVTKNVLQAALDAEMADHLGYEKGGRRRSRPGFTATAPTLRQC